MNAMRAGGKSGTKESICTASENHLISKQVVFYSNTIQGRNAPEGVRPGCCPPAGTGGGTCEDLLPGERAGYLSYAGYRRNSNTHTPPPSGGFVIPRIVCFCGILGGGREGVGLGGVLPTELRGGGGVRGGWVGQGGGSTC